MKGTKHSRHSSESTSARRRESQRTNNLAQVQAYQQQLNGGYYPSQIPGAEVEVYEPGGGGGGYQPSPGLAPPAPYQYHQRQEVEHDEDAEGSSSSRGWQDEAYLQQINQLNAQTQQIRRHQAAQQQMAQQQQLQQQQQQQLRLEKENENKSKSLLDIKHRPSSGAWSMRDDQQLISARMQNLNWSQIQQKYFPGKSSNACRKRHERLIDSKGRGNDETIRLERIAVEYVNMREELWSPLAKKTGENWKYIERQVSFLQPQPISPSAITNTDPSYSVSEMASRTYKASRARQVAASVSRPTPWRTWPPRPPLAEGTMTTAVSRALA